MAENILGTPEYIKKKGVYRLIMYEKWGLIETKALDGQIGNITAMRRDILKIWASITDTLNTPKGYFDICWSGRVSNIKVNKYDKMGMI